MLRRVVTEVVDGRSRVAIDGAAAEGWIAELWVTTPESPYGVDPAQVEAALEPPAGGTRFRIATLPPDAVMRAALAEQATAGVDAHGVHATTTVDYVYILDGPVELELDEGSVMLQPGDCVVQRGTRHAWRNRNDTPIRLLTVMVSAARNGGR
ncbi:MAG: cupin domain-containing protein [Candidatus Binatia bacterium]